MAVIDTGAQSSLISSEMKIRINQRHPGFHWHHMTKPPIVRGLQEEPLKLEPYTAHLNIRTCGREICGPVNIDPSNSFDILLGIPAIKALGIELRIQKQYELRPTYGPLRYAECNLQDKSETEQITALERASVYQGNADPSALVAEMSQESNSWQTLVHDDPVSRAELKCSYSGSAPCLKKTKKIFDAQQQVSDLKGTPKVYTKSTTTTFPAEASTTLHLRVQGGNKEANYLMELSRDLAKKGLVMGESIVKVRPCKTVVVTIDNPTTTNVVLEKGTQVGNLEGDIEILTVDQVVEEILQKTEESSKIGLNQTSPESLFDRIEQVKEIVRKQLPEPLRDHPDGKAMIALLVEHHEVLSLSDREMGHAKGVIHEIDTGDHRPIALPIRRMPYGDREEVKKQLEDLLASGVIVPSKSEWAFPTVLIRKKDDNKIRICIDYRELNLITVKDRYPLPRCDDLLDMAGQGGAKYFTKLDLKAGYHHIKMSEEAQRKSAFITWMGNNPRLFEFVYMPFGLVAAPATFQRCMNNALQGLDQS
ncbi:MAG: hypothetical protein GY937_21795, partial [bacterium]|nr:hypothetical protein [bacterium]